jgi:hypothetical protein
MLVRLKQSNSRSVWVWLQLDGMLHTLYFYKPVHVKWITPLRHHGIVRILCDASSMSSEHGLTYHKCEARSAGDPSEALKARITFTDRKRSTTTPTKLYHSPSITLTTRASCSDLLTCNLNIKEVSFHQPSAENRTTWVECL